MSYFPDETISFWLCTDRQHLVRFWSTSVKRNYNLSVDEAIVCRAQSADVLSDKGSFTPDAVRCGAVQRRTAPQRTASDVKEPILGNSYKNIDAIPVCRSLYVAKLDRHLFGIKSLISPYYQLDCECQHCCGYFVTVNVVVPNVFFMFLFLDRF